MFWFLFVQVIYIVRETHGETLLEGNITVAGLFTIYKSENGACSGIAPSSVKLLEAVKWTFRQLNEREYIPGITIGLDAWPTCQSTAEASDRTIDLIYRIREDKNDAQFTKPPLVALIGPNYSDQTEKSSSLLNAQRSEDRLIQLGFSSTAASLSNTDVYTNFFRVVPSDAVQTEVMVSLMVELEWNYIAIIHDDDIYGTEGKTALTNLANEQSICIAASFSISSGAVSISRLQSILRSIVQNAESQITGVVLFTNERHITEIMSVASTLQNEISDQLSFIISESLGLSDSYLKDGGGNLYGPAKGVYVVSPPQLRIEEFDTYWINTFQNAQNVVKESKTNKWLSDIYKFYSGCDVIQGTGCPNLSAADLEILSESPAWTSYVVKATFVIAKVLKDTHNKLCNGVSGLCLNMKNVLYKSKGDLLQEMNDFTADIGTDFPFAPNALENISLAFKSSNDVKYQAGFPDYESYHYRRCVHNPNLFCFEKIGTYAGKTLSIDKSLLKDYHNNVNGNSWPNINRAQCQNGRKCSSCIFQDNSEKIYFKDGDIIIGGIVPVYNRGTSSPLACAEIRTSLGTELVLAMEYATSLINNRTHPFEHIFPGKKIGFIILNSCNQPLLIKNKLITLLKNGLILDSRTAIDIASKLIGWVGAYGSSISVASSEVLSLFGFLQIAYASTATTLADRSLYPYFMRVATPDNKQANVLIHVIKHSHYDSDYIQVVYSEGTYGEAGMDAIRKAAKSQGVCIANEIKFTDTFNVNSLIEELRRHSSAKIVIIFIMSAHVKAVTSALNEMDYGEFMLIGSEAWGYRPGDFIDKPKLAGSIVLSLQMPQNNNFTRYLNTIDIQNTENNPWIMEYVQNKFDCYMPTSFDKRYSGLCNNNLRLANSDSYKQEIWTPFALNAALALISGSSDAFQTLCGKNSANLCDQYKRNPLAVIEKIKSIKIDVDGSGNSVPLFDDNGDGIAGYTIYNLQRNPDDANEVIYKKVGNFPLGGSSIVLNVNDIAYPDDIQLPSTCPNEYACNACKQEEGAAVVVTKSDDSNAAVSALGAIVGILLVAIIIMVVIFVLYYRRNKRMEPKQYDYIDAVYDPHHQRCYCSAETIQNGGHQCGLGLKQQHPHITQHTQEIVHNLSREQRSNNFGRSTNTNNQPHYNIALHPSYSESKDSSLNPDSLIKDDYITPCEEMSGRSDTEPKKIENDCCDSVQTSHSNSSQLPAKPEMDQVVAESDSTTRNKEYLNNESPHGERMAIVRPLEDSPQLRNSAKRSPQIAVVPGIPHS